MAKKIFISYSQEDIAHRQRIEKLLKAWIRSEKVSLWHRDMLNVSEEISTRIAEEISNSEIVLVLLSSDYLADDFLYTNELAPALQRFGQEKLVFVPIIVRPCIWQDALPKDIVVLPNLEKTIIEYDDDVEVAWLAVITALKEVVENGAKGISIPEEEKKREITMTKTIHIPVDNQGNFNFSQTINNDLPPNLG